MISSSVSSGNSTVYQAGEPIASPRQNPQTPATNSPPNLYYPSGGQRARNVEVRGPRTHRPTQAAGRKAALKHFGVMPPRQPQPTIAGQLLKTVHDWTGWAAEGVHNLVRDTQVLPGVGAASVPPPADEPTVLGEGGYLIATFDFSGAQTAQERKAEVSNHREVADAVKAVAGDKSVSLLQQPARSSYPFVRNLASEGPHGMVISDPTALGSMPQAQAIKNLRSHFDANDIPYDEVNSPVNFADVDYVPAADLLVLAHNAKDPGSPLRNQKVDAQLQRVFGNPENVIRYELDTSAVDKLGRLKCYDGDLAMHIMRNQNGELVALVHKPCIVKDPANSKLLSRQEVLTNLKELGIQVIEISAADQQELATNVLSIDGQPGHVLMPSDKISDGLKKKLADAGIVVHYAASGKVLGGKLAPGVAMYGIHCMTLNLRKPERSGDARGKPAKVDL